MNYRRRGVVLLLVLIVVTMLAMATLSFAELMLEEHRAAQTCQPSIASPGLCRVGR